MCVSAHFIEEIRERCEEAGMDGMLQKPMTPGSIEDTLRMLSSKPTKPIATARSNLGLGGGNAAFI